MSLKRVTKELIDTRNNPVPGCSFTPVEDNLFHLEGQIQGPEDSPYAGGIFFLDITIPTDYPFKPPKMTFKTRIFHPHVNLLGHIDCCFCLLEDDWSPGTTIMQVLVALRKTMLNFNREDWLKHWMWLKYLSEGDVPKDRGEFERRAREWTRRYALIPGQHSEQQEEEPSDQFPTATVTPWSITRLLMPLLPRWSIKQPPSEAKNEESPLPASAQQKIKAPPDLTGKLRRLGDYPSVHGGNADIWICEYNGSQEYRKVAVKVIRSIPQNESHAERIRQRFALELNIWQTLCHHHVLPLVGVCSGFGPTVSLVSPWMEHGNITHYLADVRPQATISDRLELLSQIATGLEYLHSNVPLVVHGDLKSPNVLINHQGEACLSDFGLSRIFEEVSGSTNYTTSLAGSLRWMAPEFLELCDNGQALQPSIFTDIYAFGSVMMEVLAGCVPYHNLHGDALVIIALHRGETPSRPDSPLLLDHYWDFIQSCWSRNPKHRPLVAEIKARLTELKLLDARG